MTTRLSSSAVLATLVVFAGLVGAVVAYRPLEGVAGLAALIGAGVFLSRPAWSLVGFAAAILGSEWAFDAQQVGLINVPYRVLAVTIWGSIVVLFGALAFARAPEDSPLRREVEWIIRPLIWYAIAVAISVGIAGITTGAQQALADLPIVALVLSPLAVMALLYSTGRPRLGLGLLVAILGLEAGYAALQWPRLGFGTEFGWFTLGSEHRWWDSRALFGTFVETGNHAFADSLVLLGAVILPWATSDRLKPRMRAFLYVLYIVVVAMVALSLARAALLSLALAATATLITRRSRRATVAVLLALVVVLALPQTSGALSQIYERGVVDTSATYRLLIWRTLADNPQPEWIIGTGANSITRVTRDLGISIPHTGDQNLGPTTDNLYLRTLIESGVFGLVTLIIFLSSLFRGSFATGRGPDDHVWRRCLRALVVALAVQSISSDTIANPVIAAVFACVLGAIGAGLLYGKVLQPIASRTDPHVSTRQQLVEQLR